MPLTVLSLVFFVAACTSVKDVRVAEYFDESTYTAVIRANRSALFLARNQAISAHGGDMVSVGPVYTILTTAHKQALWLGFWTTLDRHGLSATQIVSPTSILLSVDGVDFKLEEDKSFVSEKRSNWQTYPPPAPGTINRYFLISDEQLLQISKANVIALRVSGENKTEAVYHAQSSLKPIVLEFIEHVK